MSYKKRHKKSAKEKKINKTSSEKSPVRAKKYLGQHFLEDEAVAQKIAQTLELKETRNVIEIGPGTGVLTKYLLLREIRLVAMDLDAESIVYLNHSFRLEHPNAFQTGSNLTIIEADFLTYDLSKLFQKEPFVIIGNFPYNISTQIVFRLLENRAQIPEFSGMFQKEVAQRICEKEGSKAYGILSVLVQAFYTTTYLFTVSPSVFNPPPRVQSGVLRLQRKENYTLDCDEKLFFKVVKAAFNQRRKTLRNSLKTFDLSHILKEDTIFDQRPEQLSVAQFVMLTKKIAHDTI